MSWFVTNLLGAFLLPPLNCLLLAVAGLCLWQKRPRLARGMVGAALLLLWLLSTPLVAEGLLHTLEDQAVEAKTQAADAIVVLGAGTYFNAPEYGGDTVSEGGLVRLRYAATLYRATHKPILVTGGKPLGNALSEAAQMRSVLEQEFNVPVQWTEDASDNTLENARYSYRLLQPLGIKRIYLLSHAWHLPRARRAFEAAGFEVVLTPTAYTTRYQTDVLSCLPSATALRNSQIFMHEMIGLLWYRLRG